MPRRPLLDVAETARFLGLTPKTIFQQRWQGVEPGTLGFTIATGSRGTIRFDPDELDRWLEDRKAERHAGAADQ